MNIKERNDALNELVKKGEIVAAVEQFFAEDVKTFDYGGSKTESKAEMVDKMKSFAGNIETVHEITFHGSWVEDDTSISDFHFRFTMKDGSKIDWHELIKRTWNTDSGMVIAEEYFQAI